MTVSYEKEKCGHRTNVAHLGMGKASEESETQDAAGQAQK